MNTLAFNNFKNHLWTLVCENFKEQSRITHSRKVLLKDYVDRNSAGNNDNNWQWRRPRESNLRKNGDHGFDCLRLSTLSVPVHCGVLADRSCCGLYHVETHWKESEVSLVRAANLFLLTADWSWNRKRFFCFNVLLYLTIYKKKLFVIVIMSNFHENLCAYGKSLFIYVVIYCMR